LANTSNEEIKVDNGLKQRNDVAKLGKMVARNI